MNDELRTVCVYYKYSLREVLNTYTILETIPHAIKIIMFMRDRVERRNDGYLVFGSKRGGGVKMKS